jgi:hypothetical protein
VTRTLRTRRPHLEILLGRLIVIAEAIQVNTTLVGLPALHLVTRLPLVGLVVGLGHVVGHVVRRGAAKARPRATQGGTLHALNLLGLNELVGCRTGAK